MFKTLTLIITLIVLILLFVDVVFISNVTDWTTIIDKQHIEKHTKLEKIFTGKFYITKEINIEEQYIAIVLISGTEYKININKQQYNELNKKDKVLYQYERSCITGCVFIDSLKILN